MTIKEAYGEHYEDNKDFIDDRGWTTWYIFDWGGIFQKYEVEQQGNCWRPIVLKELDSRGPAMFDFNRKN